MSEYVRHLALRIEEMPPPEQWNLIATFNQSSDEYAISTGAAVVLIEGLSAALGDLMSERENE